jgi:hypothetical protein
MPATTDRSMATGPEPNTQSHAARPRRWLPTPKTGAKIALAGGLIAVLVALGIVLSASPLAVAGTDGIPAELAIGHFYTSQTSCQPGGALPRGTTAIRVSLSANIGPRVDLEVLSGSTLVSEGEREAGWGVDETVTVPIQRVPRGISHARICVMTGPVVEPLQVNGALVRAPDGNTALLRLEYLRPRSASWLSLLPSIARRMGLAHAPAGTWVAYMLIAVMAAVAAIATRLALRELG